MKQEAFFARSVKAGLSLDCELTYIPVPFLQDDVISMMPWPVLMPDNLVP